MLAAIYVLVFSLLWEVTSIDHYPLFLLCGLSVWLFVSSSLTGAARSMLDYAELIKKVRFPRQLVAFSVVATQLVPFAVLLGGLIVVNAIVLDRTRDTVLLSIPVAAGIVVLAAGMALAVASANVVFRDVEHLLAALLLPWFFLTPILYSLEELPGGLEDYDIVVDLLRWANPLTPPLYALRDPLFYGEVPAAGDVIYLVVAAAVSLGDRRARVPARRRPHRRRALAELEHERGVVDPRLVGGRAEGRRGPRRLGDARARRRAARTGRAAAARSPGRGRGRAPTPRAACEGGAGRRAHPRRPRTPRRGAPARCSPILPSSEERGRSQHRGEPSPPLAGARRRPRSACRCPRARRTTRGARRRGRARSRSAPAASALARRSRARRSRRGPPDPGARCESRPRRSRCRARRASGTTRRCRRPRLPRRRSRPLLAPSSALRRAADRATTSASVRREARARH